MPLPICHQPDSVANLQAFLARWPLEKVRAMKLEEYTKARAGDDDESFKASFCYALEQTTPVGIGGSSAIKFAIYARANLEKDPGVRKALFDKLYCWKEDLGKTSSEVFAKVRELIVDIVEASQAGDYDRVERNPLSRMLKWKIAFLYQNPAKPGIVGCLNEGNIRDYFDEDDKPIVQLHAQAMERFKDSPSLQEIGLQIWNETSERVKEPKNDESAESDDAPRGRRFWNFSYGQDDADGINDYLTLIKTGEIRGNWPTDDSLAILPVEKESGKAAALEMIGSDDPEDDESVRRPTFNFFHMGIPKGAVLRFVADPSRTVQVVDERRVSFNGEIVSMSDVTQRLRGKDNYYVGPMPHWTFEGEKLSKRYNRTYPNRTPTGKALMCWLFAKKMKPGDIIFARQAKSQLYMAGMVTSDYSFDVTRQTYQHVRKVHWLTTQQTDVPKAVELIPKALTDMSYGWWLTYVDEISAKLGLDLDKLPPVPEKLGMVTGNSMNKPTNVILYGPPGTGKTFHTKEHAVTLCNGKANPGTLKDDFAKLVADKRVAFVTFHQSYDYSDFIIGFKPVPSASGMSFEVRKGVLMRLAEEAEKNPQLPYLLIIDEINRGNISKIFGELITLIEADKRRDGDFPLEVTLPCAFKGTDGQETCQFSLPSNVHLLGTMNTADRSIALLDTALRRRFKFERKDPQPDLLHADLGGVKLRKLLTKLNEILADAFSPDHQIGHAWMPMKFDSKATGDDLIAAFNDKILPLFDEWYYDNIDAKKELLGQLTEDGEVTLPALKKFAES
jgi:hypothetical protein